MGDWTKWWEGIGERTEAISEDRYTTANSVYGSLLQVCFSQLETETPGKFYFLHQISPPIGGMGAEVDRRTTTAPSAVLSSIVYTNC